MFYSGVHGSLSSLSTIMLVKGGEEREGEEVSSLFCGVNRGSHSSLVIILLRRGREGSDGRRFVPCMVRGHHSSLAIIWLVS